MKHTPQQTTRATVTSRFRPSGPASTALLCALLLALLTACGGAPVPTRGVSSSSSGATTAAGIAPTVAPVLASGGAAAPTPAGAAGSQPPQSSLPDSPKMVIKNGTLSLVVRDVDSAVNQIVEIAIRHGGDVRQSTNNKSGDLRVADMLILVESGQFDKAMAAIRGIDGLVDRKVDKTESQEVSEEFVDVKAQIATLEATERQLRAQMERTSRTEDILAIQRELTNVRGQIDRLQSRANFLDRRSAMSTIALHIEMPLPANAAGKPRSAVDPVAEWRFSESVAASWRASLRVVQAAGTVVVSILVFCWWLVPLAGLGWVAARLIRRRPGNGVPPAPPAPAAGA